MSPLSSPISLRIFIVLLLLLIAVAASAPVLAQDQETPTEAIDGGADQDDGELLWDDEDEFQDIEISDPIEPVNRVFFWVNDKLYFYLLKPVARGYRVVPEPVRNSVSRAFSNLATPVRFVNATLQFKFKVAGKELGRFLVNSTFGLLGLFDPAKQFGWHKQEEDFGQTLGYYGVGQGVYLVLPIFGPSSLRDGVGLFADSLVEPIPSPYYMKLKFREVAGLKTYEQVNKVSLGKDTYEGIKRDALDPYLFVRNAYLQHRAAKVEE